MIHKTKINSSLLIGCLILTVGSCVEPIVPVLNEKDTQSVLVVDGKITDEAGPFRVRLSKSVEVNVLYYLDPVLDADVWIHDDKGNSFHLYSVNYGWYETADKDLKGIAGNSYTLAVTTADGIQYESSSVLMSEVPDIDRVYFEEVTRTRLEDKQGIDETWADVLIDTHDPEGKVRYWYYQFEETWEVKMLTRVEVEHTPPGSPFKNKTFETVLISDDKSVCWVTKPSSSVLIANTASSPVDELKGFPVQSLAPSEDRLHIRYSILVKQSAISRELFEFWKQLKDVNEDSGGLYEKLPAQVFGNITCCEGTGRALGYFSAMSVKAKRLFIDKTAHHVQTQSAYAGCSYYDYSPNPFVPRSFFGTLWDGTEVYCSSDYCADCRTYGTNVKPDFW